MTVGVVLSLLGGLAFFLFGMRTMGEGLERAAGPKLKHFLALMTRSRVIAMLTGIAVTALIQSSGAATVMVVGFVNAQMLSLSQAVGVIIGANVGTTITSLLLSIKFDPGPCFAFAGFLMIAVFDKKETVKQTGFVFMGLGMLFQGMRLMSESMEPLRTWPVFLRLMQRVRHPLTGLLTGVLVTALLQSSSVSVGIVQMLAASGLVSLQGALYLVLGAKIGACTPSLLAMADSTISAKRAAMIHLLFNCLSALIVLALSLILPLTEWAQLAATGNPKLSISLLHIGSSVLCAFLLLPVSDGLVKLSALILPGGKEERKAPRMRYYDPRLNITPSLAAEQLYREVCRMGRETREHIALSLDALKTLDLSREQEINDHEALADFLEERITEGLAAVMAADLSDHETRRVFALFHAVHDIERISDHAMHLLRLAKARMERGAEWSDQAAEELGELFRQTMNMLDAALTGLEERTLPDTSAGLLREDEKNVDAMTRDLRGKHVQRLMDQTCTPKSGMIFLEAVSHLERVSGHARSLAACARGEPLHTRC